jgi:hypothetical protein
MQVRRPSATMPGYEDSNIVTKNYKSTFVTDHDENKYTPKQNYLQTLHVATRITLMFVVSMIAVNFLYASPHSGIKRNTISNLGVPIPHELKQTKIHSRKVSIDRMHLDSNADVNKGSMQSTNDMFFDTTSASSLLQTR